MNTASPRPNPSFSRFLALAGAIALCLRMPVPASAAPNVVIILCDDMGWSDIGCYGGEVATPNLDSLASGGLRFRRFYNEARCSPTRAALLTGLHMQTSAVDANESLPNLRTDNNATIAELLQANGYRTYMSGKWHLGGSEANAANEKNPLNRGFQHAYGGGANANLPAGGSYWRSEQFSFVSINNEIAPIRYDGTDPDASLPYYKTDAITDYAVRFLDHHFGKSDGKPFFLYLAYTAPHFYLQAPQEEINKYTDVADATPSDEDIFLYEQGWDVVRQFRHERMLANGVLGSNARLSPKGFQPPSHGATGGYDMPDWAGLTSDQKNDLSRRMAVYAAMIDRMDQNVGRVIQRLQAAGALEDTLILFLSDNGASAEGNDGAFGRTAGAFEDGVQTNRDAAFPLTGTDLENMGQGIVPPETLEEPVLYIGGGWANVSNTPLRFYKHHTHEGGCRTPFIVHWPNGMDPAVDGSWTAETGHVTDIMPTVLQATGIAYPASFAGRTLEPLQGASLLPVLQGGKLAPRDLFVEHERNRAMFRGKWKLVTKEFVEAGDPTDLPADTPELYDMDRDPSETDNLAFHRPEILATMIEGWNAWVADQNSRLPVGEALDLNRQLPAATPDPLLPNMPLGDELLFDTFNRPDNDNEDGSREGLSGRMINWNNAAVGDLYHEGSTPGNIRVVGGTLRIAENPTVNMAEIGTRVNFLGPEIVAAGGFAVEAELVVYSQTSTNSNLHFAGLAVGLTPGEAATGAALNNPGSFRGNGGSNPGTADCAIELDLEGDIKLWIGGNLVTEVPAGALVANGSASGHLLAAFELEAGFAAGDNVGVTVYFNGVPVASGAFQWSATDSNHLGLFGRAENYAQFDNLTVRKLPLKKALARYSLAQAGLSGMDLDLEGDQDGDGRSNEVEWLLGTDATVVDAGFNPLVLSMDAGNDFVLSFPMIRSSQAAGLNYRIRHTDDLTLPLASWEILDSTPTDSPIAGWPAYQNREMRWTPPVPAPGRQFFLLEVEPSP